MPFLLNEIYNPNFMHTQTPNFKEEKKNVQHSGIVSKILTRGLGVLLGLYSIPAFLVLVLFTFSFSF